LKFELINREYYKNRMELILPIECLLVIQRSKFEFLIHRNLNK